MDGRSYVSGTIQVVVGVNGVGGGSMSMSMFRLPRGGGCVGEGGDAVCRLSHGLESIPRPFQYYCALPFAWLQSVTASSVTTSAMSSDRPRIAVKSIPHTLPSLSRELPRRASCKNDALDQLSVRNCKFGVSARHHAMQISGQRYLRHIERHPYLLLLPS